MHDEFAAVVLTPGRQVIDITWWDFARERAPLEIPSFFPHHLDFVRREYAAKDDETPLLIIGALAFGDLGSEFKPVEHWTHRGPSDWGAGSRRHNGSCSRSAGP